SAVPVSSAVMLKSGLEMLLSQTYGVTCGAAKAAHIKQKSCGGKPLLMNDPLSNWPFGGFARFEVASRPYDLHHRAMAGKNPVAEGDRGAGALEQRAGDEHAKPEPAMLARGLVGMRPARQIGFADPLDDF